MRIFLLRLLIGWWIIPLLLIIGLPVMWLIDGDLPETIDDARYIMRVFWYGDE